MFTDKHIFKNEYLTKLGEVFAKPANECSKQEKYFALVVLIRETAAKMRAESGKANGGKEVYYFSMEFLLGRLLRNYLINLGIEGLVSEGLGELGVSLDELCECERDPGLGNGGLGRLAACFLDSMAHLGMNATGMGIRYRFGLFEQHIENGWQTAKPDPWLTDGYPWEVKHPGEAVSVRFGGSVGRYEKNGRPAFYGDGGYFVRAIPYDVPIIGENGSRVNTLRLWRAMPENEHFDMPAFNRGDYSLAVKARNDAEAISCILYPDDSTDAGRELRLKQEYFFVCAGITSILRRYRANYGSGEWDKLPERVSMHINDTHPALCVPELMRQLLDDEGLEWDEAWDITTRTVSYTNHTILPEALERWPAKLMQSLLPRIYMIIEEIDRRFKLSVSSHPHADAVLPETEILRGGEVRMANLSVIGSHSVNGVAALHSEILKKETLKSFYILTPEKFGNKTNGVSHRRFLVESNPALTSLISEAIGTAWIREPDRLEELLKFKDDSEFLRRLSSAKRAGKERLSKFISDKNHIAVDPDSIFDIHVKRIHAYKRQLLNVFKIIDVYTRLKENPSLDIPPSTFIFAGKAAQSYAFAREVIKLICSIADVVNSDRSMDGKLKVVFLENFGVSMAQLIYPAADISEQISTAGKEASGTGNMKFMMNGAVTLGTLDGANVEIAELVGRENIRIFGLTADEAMALACSGKYSPTDELSGCERLSGVTDRLTNGFFNCSGHIFTGVRDALCGSDEYFVLRDFMSYVTAWEDTVRSHRDTESWQRMALVNIAKSGRFSSDRTIREYARDIWHA